MGETSINPVTSRIPSRSGCEGNEKQHLLIGVDKPESTVG